MNPLLYRKTVRDAIVAVLAEPSTGFNARLAAYATTYGITPITIDFTGAADNFALSRISIETLEQSALINLDPLSACLFTGPSADTGLPRGIPFSGTVDAHLRLFYRPRSGAEGYNTEDWIDAIEDAALSAINSPSVVWPINQSISVIFSRQCAADRTEIHQLSDGHMQMSEIRIPFEVRAR